MSLFTRQLLAWYDLHGRKNLPWQGQGSYAVWISEIMLQQTQVKTVIPYYHAFISRFPDALALAQAEQDEILHYWSGLGYYRRAIHLHQAAQVLVRDYAGILPDRYEDIIRLPGIGTSTAAAILSQAFHQPKAILDTHVKRILIRFYALQAERAEQGKTHHHSIHKQLRHYADYHVSRERPAAYTQAIMDLGALICTPRHAQCNLCPVAQECMAKAHGLIYSLPLKPVTKPKPLPEMHKQLILFVNTNQEVWLQRRDYAAVWQGLWSLPELDITVAATISDTPMHSHVESSHTEHSGGAENSSNSKDNKNSKDNTVPADLTEAIIQLAERFGFTVRYGHALRIIKHRFSHYLLHIHPFYVAVQSEATISGTTIAEATIQEDGFLWYSLNNTAPEHVKNKKIGLPGPVAKLLHQIANMDHIEANKMDKNQRL